MLREHCESSHPHYHTAHHPLQPYVIPPAYLFDVRVEGDRHVQQDFALLHAANKVLDSVFELVGGLVDLLWVALSRLGQLLGRLQQLVSISVRILHRRGDEEREGDRLTQEDDTMQVKQILNTSRDRESKGREKVTNRICRSHVQC